MYTNINTHDPAAREETITVQYRKQLIERQIRPKTDEKTEHDLQNTTNCQQLSNVITDPALSNCIVQELKDLRDCHDNAIKVKTVRKLNRLYRGQVYLQEDGDAFVNLSDHSLTDDQKDLLNLGLNCHLQPKYDRNKKKIELEILYESLISLQNRDKVTINPDLKEQLRNEATIRRSNNSSRLLTPRLRTAAKQLRDNKDIVIRRADKSNIFVLLNATDYNQKIEEILNDSTKFTQTTRDPTEPLQRKVNKLITTANATIGKQHLKPIVGSYSPGYIYGNVKTHKTNHPLRPIISQVF